MTYNNDKICMSSLPVQRKICKTLQASSTLLTSECSCLLHRPVSNTYLPRKCHSPGEIRSGWEAVSSKSSETRERAIGEQLGHWQNNGKNWVTSPCAHSISSVQGDGWSSGRISLICYRNSNGQNQGLIAKWISTGFFCASSLKINHLVHSPVGALTEHRIWAVCTVGRTAIYPFAVSSQGIASL